MKVLHFERSTVRIEGERVKGMDSKEALEVIKQSFEEKLKDGLLNLQVKWLIDRADEAERLIDRLETAERQREEAVKALEWYGDEDNHKWSHTYDETGEVEEIPSKVANDRGKLAVTTIKRIKGENG